MRPTDDTSIKGQILTHAARAVGATKAASFEVFREGQDTYAIKLHHFRAYDGSDQPTAEKTAEAMRRFVIPCLVEGRRKVFEFSEGTGLGGKQFVLVTLIQDQTNEVRFVGAFLVTCQYAWQAEQRLDVLRQLSEPDMPAHPEAGREGPGAGQGYRDRPGS
jgi:hypothetical protein